MALVILLIVLLTGCANGPAWQPEDDAWDKTGKTLLRIPLAIGTLGLSEAMIAMDKAEREKQRTRGYNPYAPTIIVSPPNFIPPPQPLQQMRTTTQCFQTGNALSCN